MTVPTPFPGSVVRERRAIRTMVAALPVLRDLSRDMRAAFGDPAEARFADSLQFALAELLTSLAIPQSDEMIKADAALLALRLPTTDEDQPNG